MRELLVETKQTTDEMGQAHQFDYYVVIGELEVGGRFSCESYGAKVSEQGGDTAVVPNLTVSISRIDGLMECLIKNLVAPASLRDVVDDWL